MWLCMFPTLPARNPDGGTSFEYHPEFAERALLVEEVAKQGEWEDDKSVGRKEDDLADFSGFVVGGFEEGKEA